MKNPEVLAKMSKAKSKPIHQLDMSGNFLKRWDSTKLAAQHLLIHSTTIQKCCKGHLKSASGFKFIYI
jgi:hypothetical protein